MFPLLREYLLFKMLTECYNITESEEKYGKGQENLLNVLYLTVL